MAGPAPRPLAVQPRQILIGKRALVIDGDRPERQRLLEFLSGWGMSVEVTTNPLRGLSMLWDALEAARPFHLVLFGTFGHSVLGEQFVALVRSDVRLGDLPMLHIGESGGSEHKAVLRRVGFFDILPVPIDKTLLFDILHRACGALITGTGVVRLMDRHIAQGRSIPRLDILVAEPSPEQRRIVRGTLARGGHHVFEVDSGEQALDALVKHRFDLVIIALDIQGLSPADILRLLRYSVAREDWPAFIGLARESSMDKIRDSATFGVTVVVPSPVQPEALLRAIAGVIRGNGEGGGAAPDTLAFGAGTPTEVPCLDEQILREIEHLGSDPNFLYDLIQEFLSDVGTRMQGLLHTRGTAHHYLRLREFGHLLRDNAGSVGALQLYQLGLIAAQCQEEVFDREGDELLGRIEFAYLCTRDAFWRYLRQREQSRSPVEPGAQGS